MKVVRINARSLLTRSAITSLYCMLFQKSNSPLNCNELDLFICRWFAGLKPGMGPAMAAPKRILEKKTDMLHCISLTMSKVAF
jgi:hypothetical protein